MAGLPTLVNYTSGASTVAAPASFALTIPATANGSIGVAIAITANSAGGPTCTCTAGSGMIQILSQSGNASISAFAFSTSGPLTAGTTTVTFGSLTNVNGIATAFYELGNMSQTAVVTGNIDASCHNGSASASTTTPSISVQPTQANEFLIAVIGQLTGQALTRTSTPSSIWTNDAAATSTTGATNAVISPQHAFLGPSPLSPGCVASGSFGGAVQCMAILIGVLSSLSAPYVLVEAGGSGSSAVHAIGAYAGGIGG